MILRKILITLIEIREHLVRIAEILKAHQSEMYTVMMTVDALSRSFAEYTHDGEKVEAKAEVTVGVTSLQTILRRYPDLDVWTLKRILSAAGIPYSTHWSRMDGRKGHSQSMILRRDLQWAEAEIRKNGFIRTK